MDTHTTAATAQHDRRRTRRRLFFALLLLFVVAALVLAPPLLNVNRYQKRITQSMSDSLGRPVHLDGVALHLLPVPRITLTNFVVSEDPAFGSEPTIRANSVEAQLRLGSLWRRHIEFSRLNFTEPSINLVRNAEGRWNLDNILVHAARIDAAPTSQTKAGDTPRFPYIEASGARVNIKRGDEKMPFSLTEADFALWLPNPQEWRVRLVGKPARTDANIADPGVLRLEGTLRHADTLEAVPVDISASWHDAPLGEGSRLVAGSDLGWRGTLHIDASLQGSLGAATLRAKATIDGLRRADFVPQQPLDAAMECTATANAAAATLTGVACRVPVDGAEPLGISSASVNLSAPLTAPVKLDASALPLRWVFGWFKLLSPRVPAMAQPQGTITAHLARSAPQQWEGTAGLALPASAETDSKAKAAPQVLSFAPGPSTAFPGCTSSLALPATPLQMASGRSITVAAELNVCGYTLHASGLARETDLSEAAQSLPQLVDGFHAAAPGLMEPAHFDVSCTRLWDEPQTCMAAHAVATPAKKPARRHR